jgi:hypothetical protein
MAAGGTLDAVALIYVLDDACAVSCCVMLCHAMTCCDA